MLIVWVVVSSCLYENFVVVVPAATPGTLDPRQAIESVPEEGPLKLLEICNCGAFSVIFVFRIVTITAPRHAKEIFLHKLFGCPSGPRLHVEPRVVRTAARLLMMAFAEFCCCVHANYSELGASVAFPSVDRRNR